MGLPLARGPRAACCLPAFPPLFVNRLGAPPLAQEGESWPRASLAPSAGPSQEGAPADCFSVLPPQGWQGKTRLPLSRVKGAKLTRLAAR